MAKRKKKTARKVKRKALKRPRKPVAKRPRKTKRKAARKKTARPTTTVGRLLQVLAEPNRAAALLWGEPRPVEGGNGSGRKR